MTPWVHIFYFELENGITDNFKLSKVVKTNWKKTRDVIMFHLMLVRGMSGIMLAYLLLKVANITPGYDANLNLDRDHCQSPIVKAKCKKFSTI